MRAMSREDSGSPNLLDEFFAPASGAALPSVEAAHGEEPSASGEPADGPEEEVEVDAVEPVADGEEPAAAAPARRSLPPTPPSMRGGNRRLSAPPPPRV